VISPGINGVGVPVERAEGPAGSRGEGVRGVLPQLRLPCMTRQAHVMGPVMFSLVVCRLHGWGMAPARLSPLVGLGWHPGPGEAIPEQHTASGEGAAGTGVCARSGSATGQRHLPRAGSGLFVLVLGPCRSQSCWREWGQRVHDAVLWRGYGGALLI
jgi:hypothetical protein